MKRRDDSICGRCGKPIKAGDRSDRNIMGLCHAECIAQTVAECRAEHAKAIREGRHTAWKWEPKEASNAK